MIHRLSLRLENRYALYEFISYKFLIPKSRLRKRLTSDQRWGFTINFKRIVQLMIIHEIGSIRVKAVNANANVLEFSSCVVFMFTLNNNWTQIPPDWLLKSSLLVWLNTFTYSIKRGGPSTYVDLKFWPHQPSFLLHVEVYYTSIWNFQNQKCYRFMKFWSICGQSEGGWDILVIPSR